MTELEVQRYPVGRFEAPASNGPGERTAEIETLRRMPERLRAALAGLSEAQLDTPYREGGWTVRQVVHHLADSHANSYLRFKLALTENCPTIKTYDEAAWARLPDSTLPIDRAIVFIEALHSRLVALLEVMSEGDFERSFNHPERGRVTLRSNLALYAWHSRHHVAHITSLRARMGW
jgi:uncharacterized damage-inducible protein DinB